MTKDEVLTRLSDEVAWIKTFPDTAKFYTPERVEELPHCPKCHRYIGEGFELSSFIYYSEKCICGYKYSE